MNRITLVNRYLLVALLLASLSGCASLNSFSMTQVPADRSHPVSAEDHDWVVWGFKFNNDITNNVRDKLHKQCPNGKVTGIMTKQETYLHLYTIIVPFWKRVVTAQGYCVHPKGNQ